MPELPEVETVARGLRTHALGRRIAEVEVRRPRVIVGSPEGFRGAIKGRTISDVRRKGKVIALALDAPENGEAPSVSRRMQGEALKSACRPVKAEVPDRTVRGEARFLVMHLGMTGQVTVVPPETPLETHTHVVLALDDGREELRFRDVRGFGRLRVASREELERLLGSLGPDAQQVSEEEFLSAMRGRRGAIKSWLMNQRVLAGLGNIYADEVLHAARLHPLAQPGHVRPIAARRLYRAMRRILARAVACQGTSFRDYLDIEGRPGNYAMRLRVYQRSGERCLRCATRIRRIVIAGRSSHFCPRCQPPPRVKAKMRGPRA
jgi:formamidopyrimidine-DNA glycosylase